MEKKNTTLLTVEMWTDFACPFCYLGKRHFEKALEAFPHKDSVRLHVRSYELSPEGTGTKGVSSYELVARKKGIDLPTSRRLHDRITTMARNTGLVYDFDTVVDANTLDAHRLVQMESDVIERVYRAHFTEGLDIEDRDILVRLAGEVGLDTDRTRSMLDSDQYIVDVRRDEGEAASRHVDGVPFFSFPQGETVYGAQPPETFLAALNTAWDA